MAPPTEPTWSRSRSPCTSTATTTYRARKPSRRNLRAGSKAYAPPSTGSPSEVSKRERRNNQRRERTADAQERADDPDPSTCVDQAAGLRDYRGLDRPTGAESARRHRWRPTRNRNDDAHAALAASTRWAASGGFRTTVPTASAAPRAARAR